MANKSVPELAVLPSSILYNDLFHIVRGGVDYQGQSASKVFAPKILTYAEASVLRLASQLIPTQIYFISSDGTTGYFLTAYTNSEFREEGIWLRNTNLKAFGVIQFTGTGGNSITSVTVAGLGEVTSGTIAWNTSDTQTAIDLAANINAVGDVRAVAIQNSVVLESLTAGGTLNAAAITLSGTVTTVLNKSMNYGVDVSIQQLVIRYDFVNNAVLYCADYVNQIQFTTSVEFNTLIGSSPIDTFRWGDTFNPNTSLDGYSSFFGCEINLSNLTDFFAYNSNCGANRIDATYFNNSVFIDSQFSANTLDLTTNDFRDVFFYDTELERNDLNELLLNDSYFSGVTIKDCIFSECDAQGLTLVDCVATAATFSTTGVLVGATLTGVDLSGTTVNAGNYNVVVKSPTLNGASGKGLSGSPIVLFPVPSNWGSYGIAMTKGSGLASATNTATLMVGIQTDFPFCLLGFPSAIIITTVNGGSRQGVSTGLSTAARYIVATPAVQDITAGYFTIVFTGQAFT